MSVKLIHSPDYALYFCSFTCFQWINLFEIANSYDSVYKWFTYLKEVKNIFTISYVIMPNHIHIILYFPDKSLILNKVISNGKRFLAYEIIERLEKDKKTDLLEKLYGSVSSRERKKGQKHRVFTDSFDAKPIYTDSFLHQKINYIHHNPVRGKWRLCNDFSDYPHSSASFYEKGKALFFEPKHYNDL